MNLDSDRIKLLIEPNQIDIDKVTVSHIEFAHDDSDEKKVLTRDLKIESVIDDIDNDEKIKEINSGWFKVPGFPSENDDDLNDTNPQIISPKISHQQITLNKTLHRSYSISYMPHEMEIESLAMENNYQDIENSLYFELLKAIKKECSFNTKMIETSNMVNFGGKFVETKKVDPTDEHSIKQMVSKIISSSDMIAVHGRIGPGQFAITNEKVYNALRYIFPQKVPIGIDWIVDGSCGDEIFIGRKNKTDQSGLQLFYRINNYVDIIPDGYGYNIISKVDWTIAEITDNCSSQYIRLKVNFK